MYQINTHLYFFLVHGDITRHILGLISRAIPVIFSYVIKYKCNGIQVTRERLGAYMKILESVITFIDGLNEKIGIGVAWLQREEPEQSCHGFIGVISVEWRSSKVAALEYHRCFPDLLIWSPVGIAERRV